MTELNKKIFDFYVNNSICGEYPPMFYGPILNSYKILSLGLNPSLTNSAIEELQEKKLLIKNFKTAEKKKRNILIDAIITNQKKLKYGENQIPYFRSLEKFFKNLDEGYNNFINEVFHYDLCQIRQTDSKVVVKQITEDPLLLDYLIKQLEFVIKILKPKIILVFNASVSKILKQRISFFSDRNLNHEHGCYFYKTTPVICANQLSGGATSGVYRDILIWNCNRLIRNLIEK